MIGLTPARKRPVDRRETQSDKTPAAQVKTFVAPVGGWVTNNNIASQSPDTAVVLDNFWPTRTGIEPRGGAELRATVTGPVRSLFEYRAANARFVATDTDVYSFPTTSNGNALTSVISGQSSGVYATLETQNDAGSFLTIVNGADDAQIYDGATWGNTTITGVNTADLSYIWAYRNRQYFIEKGTMNAWYLGVNSIGGAAEKLPLSGIFNKGGTLLFGARWSGDSGDGLDDRAVFVTDQGEFAVYAGSDPADVDNWALQGVYDLGRPLGPHAHMSVGGDLIVATEAGLVPLSAAQSKDVSQLKLDALSLPIDPEWRYQSTLSASSDNWVIAKWSARNMALVSIPSSVDCSFVVNLETGAWAKFSGWPSSYMAVLGESLFYGDSAGNVMQADTGGSDNGMPFTCRACYAFDHFGAPANYKVAGSVRATFRYSTWPTAKIEMASDYRVNFSSPPNATVVEDQVGSFWDVAIWDVSKWGNVAGAKQIESKWQSVSGQGYVLAPMVQILSSGSAKISAELASIDVTYTVGQVVTG